MKSASRFTCALAVALAACTCSAHAKEDIEFVAEHLPEVAMDNRYATLPVWSGAQSDKQSGEQPWSFAAQAGWSDIRTGELDLSGPMLSFGVRRSLSPQWLLGAFAFYDDLSFGTATEQRQLQTLFAPTDPIQRPVDATFTALGGSTLDAGLGMYAAHSGSTRWLGQHRWVAGLIWQKVRLRDYAFDYRIEAGPSRDVTGRIDFDADYEHVTPFVGFEWPRALTQWAISPHVLLAVPLPRRGFQGHITGPGFDIHGDTADVGMGKHFGDPSVTLGLDVTYTPWRLTVDLGTTLTQWLLEPHIHKGIEQNWILSAQWRY
jgi:hypothetical protein